MQAVGGIADILYQNTDFPINHFINLLREQLDAELGTYEQDIEPISYKTQTVDGVNYFAKIAYRDARIAHIRFHVSLDNQVTLHSIQHNMLHADPIVYFE